MENFDIEVVDGTRLQSASTKHWVLSSFVVVFNDILAAIEDLEANILTDPSDCCTAFQARGRLHLQAKILFWLIEVK